jgi:hypothetical protein
MIFISHRGNINGKNKDQENNPNKINLCLNMGYDVEVDVWNVDGNLYLGHDNPQHLITLDYLKNDNLWCHAKNKEALEIMLKNNIHCFWHQNDQYTLTSKGYIWVYPDVSLLQNSIAVMPELTKYSFTDLKDCYAICSDNIDKYKKDFKNA